jgi:hypothetical protein
VLAIGNGDGNDRGLYLGPNVQWIGLRDGQHPSDEMAALFHQYPNWKAMVILWNSPMASEMDDELGRMESALNQAQLLPETVLVVTALQGKAQATPGSSAPRVPEDTHQPKSKKVDYISSSGSALRYWLKDTSPVALLKFANRVRDLPGLSAIFTKQVTSGRAHYIRAYRNSQTPAKVSEWSSSHDQELLESMATSGSADVVALLQDGHSYTNSQGGAQEEIQRIPLWVVSPALRAFGTSADPVRLVDLSPIVSRLLHLPVAPEWDGSSAGIERWLTEAR